jgi:choline dehydrogenase-like flavoprotein
MSVVSTLYHAAGTAAMGKVVDIELRVYGVTRLRVVDASVLRTACPTCVPLTVVCLRTC